jgi:hypothetical protein
MDLNVRAFRTVQAAITEPKPDEKRKQAARKAGLVGGPSRAKSITPQRRLEIAQKANRARWSKESDAATAG